MPRQRLSGACDRGDDVVAGLDAREQARKRVALEAVLRHHRVDERRVISAQRRHGGGRMRATAEGGRGEQHDCMCTHQYEINLR